ncbi:transcription factor TFIIIB component B [Apiospora kogelbergensis]|uniref:transcription factor TFIIIB component B n=1 Tax=Apiospora kogelbergensis TaxID=1337665 RepID=UPI0031322017
MSSMLKKKGLGFKPKAKPARTAAPAAASPSQTPATTESPSQSQSQASTPAPPLVTPQVPTVSTPNTLGTDNAEPTIQEPQEKEREKEKDAVSNAATAVSSTTIAKPHEPPTIPPAPAPEPTNPLPTPDDRPIEPTDSRPPENSNAESTPISLCIHCGHLSGWAFGYSCARRACHANCNTTPEYRRIQAGSSYSRTRWTHDACCNTASGYYGQRYTFCRPRVCPKLSVDSPAARASLASSAPITNTVVANAAAADVQSTEAGAPTAEPRKKRQYRKRKAPAPAEGEQNGEAAPAAPKPKRQRKKKTAPEEGAENEDGTPAAPKPRRKRKNDTAPAEGGDAQVASGGEGIGVAAHTVVRRKRREPTPEDAENQEIDHTTTKMADITRDLGIGKKFKHSEAILERQREARRNAQRRRLERKQRAMGLLPEEPTGEDGAAGNNAEGTPAPEAEEPSVMDGGGVEYDIIDGQIVVNQNSLTVNQHENQDFTNLETVEEDEFTNLTTSASYLRASKTLGTNHWSDDETERFYHYLKMFGTDFETISHVFPGKSRRHIKLKFNREEKARPKRINAAIMARGAKKVAIDLEDFKSQWQGEAWQEPDNIRADQARVAAQYEEHLEELRQQRRELGLLDDEEPAPAANSDAAEGGEDGGPAQKGMRARMPMAEMRER